MSRQQLNNTQHPSLVGRTALQQPQPAVAVKLFQFDSQVGQRALSAGPARPTVVSPTDSTAFSAVVRPGSAQQQNQSRHIPQHHPRHVGPTLAGALRPSAAGVARSTSGANNNNMNAAAAVGQQMLPGASSSSSVLQQQQHPHSAPASRGNNNNAPAAAAATATMTSRTTPAAVTSAASAKSRATSTDLLYDRFRSKGGYGPECTQMNILHTRHKIQFQYGRMRRVNSNELQTMIRTVKQGIRSAGKIWSKENDARVAEIDAALDDTQRPGARRSASQSSKNNNTNSVNNNKEGVRASLPRSASAAQVAALAQQRSTELERLASGSNAVTSEFVDDVNDEDDDAIEEAFRSEINSRNKQQQQAGRAKSATFSPGVSNAGPASASSSRRPGSALPTTTTTDSVPPRAPTSAHSTAATTTRQHGASATTNEHPSTTRGRSTPPIEPGTFRGATASLEKSYLENLGTFLSPSVARKRRNPSAHSLQRQQKQQQQQQQQQEEEQNNNNNNNNNNKRSRSNSPTGSAAGSASATSSPHNSPPPTATVFERKISLGIRNRSPLTASILKSFASDAVRETRTPSAAKSRPASADYLLGGSRWHNDVDHGDVPEPTAVNPADLPQPASDLRLESLPEELRFYAVSSSSPKRYNLQPPPSYFFDEPDVPQLQREKGFSPEALRANPIYNQLAMPSKYRSQSAGAVRRPVVNNSNAGSPGATVGSVVGTGFASPIPTSAAAAAAASAPGTPPTPNTAQLREVQRAEAEMKQRIAALQKTKGIAEYLYERKQQCYCQYSSVIRRKMLELDQRRRMQQM